MEAAITENMAAQVGLIFIIQIPKNENILGIAQRFQLDEQGQINKSTKLNTMHIPIHNPIGFYIAVECRTAEKRIVRNRCASYPQNISCGLTLPKLKLRYYSRNAINHLYGLLYKAFE